MAEVLREHLEGHSATTALNADSFGTVTLFRAYPDGVDTWTIVGEGRAPTRITGTRSGLEYNRAIYRHVHEEAMAGRGVMISLTENYRHTEYWEEMVALKSFITPPFADSEWVARVVAKVLEARVVPARACNPGARIAEAARLSRRFYATAAPVTTSPGIARRRRKPLSGASLRVKGRLISPTAGFLALELLLLRRASRSPKGWNEAGTKTKTTSLFLRRGYGACCPPGFARGPSPLAARRSCPSPTTPAAPPPSQSFLGEEASRFATGCRLRTTIASPPPPSAAPP